MTEYTRLKVAADISKNSDFVPLREKLEAEWNTLSPNVYRMLHGNASTTAVTYGLAPLVNTPTALLIYNMSSTAAEVIDVTWWHQKWTGNDTVSFAQVATGDTITDDSLTSTWATAPNNAAVGDWVRLSNCASAVNDGAWQIRGLTDTVITLVAEMTVVGDLNDALTLSFERRNTQGIAPGGFLLLTDNIVGAPSISIRSESGTPQFQMLCVAT